MNLPDFQLPVPANPPDAGTMIAVQFGQDWIPALLTVLEVMRGENFFVSAPSDIQEQIDELNDRLQNTLIITPQLFPIRDIHFHINSLITTGGGMVWTIDAAQAFNGYAVQSPALQFDKTHFYMFLEARTYQFQRFGVIGTGQGIMTVKIGSNSPFTMDCYNATQVKNSRLQQNFTLTQSGVVDVTIEMATKNGASAGYSNSVTYFLIQ